MATESLFREYYSRHWNTFPFGTESPIKEAPFRDFYSRNARWLAKKVGGSPKILALGSGSGTPEFDLAMDIPGSRLHTLDFADFRPMLPVDKMERNRDRLPVASLIGHPRHTIADIRILPFRSRSVNLVLSSFAFDLTGNQTQATRELKRVLAPGGGAVLILHRPGSDVLANFGANILLSQILIGEKLRVLEQAKNGRFPPAITDREAFVADQQDQLHTAELNKAASEHMISLAQKGLLFRSARSIRAHFRSQGFDVLRVEPLSNRKSSGWGVVLRKMRKQ
ncbi:MAG TPA: class I SAM-dependent methyltransferase [Candidatus Norongarragalinales archaeon]|nr:class I SAM-dependent methyltransferase [Candidatus Norongarragalinales archaeon]